MLVRVAVDCAVLEPTDDPRSASDQRRLAWALREHGVLMCTEGHDLKRMLPQLDVNTFQVWNAVIADIHSLDCGGATPCLCTTDEPAVFRQAWADRADIAVVEKWRGKKLGLPEDESVKWDSAAGIEMVHLWSFHEAKAFDQARALATRAIWKGDDRKKVWEDRFDLLARTSLHVTVVDRYAGQNLVMANRSDQMSGLEWFLRRLCCYPRTYVTLILGVTDYWKMPAYKMANKDQVLEAVKGLVAELPEDGVEDIKLYLVLEDEFGEISHGRRIRFESHVVSLDTGLEVFEAAKVRRPCDCANPPMSDAKDYEDWLKWVASLRTGWPADVRLREANV